MPRSSSRRAAHAHLAAGHELRKTWESWQKGGSIVCGAEGSPVALSVDGGTARYRFVCVTCGNASPWFDVRGGTLHERPPSGSFDTQRPEP